MTLSYVVLDGPDGCGKSTQAARLVDRFRADGRAVRHLREPGSTSLGEKLREQLLRGDEIGPLAEALLFSAARAEMVRVEVAPAIARGELVVAERCFLSTLVYQCLAPAEDDRVPLELILDVSRAVHAECKPDVIVVLDVPVEVSTDRLRTADHDRFESRGPEFTAAVRAGFRRLAQDSAGLASLVHRAVELVDATHDPDAVTERVLAALFGGSPSA